MKRLAENISATLAWENSSAFRVVLLAVLHLKLRRVFQRRKGNTERLAKGESEASKGLLNLHLKMPLLFRLRLESHL